MKKRLKENNFCLVAYIWLLCFGSMWQLCKASNSVSQFYKTFRPVFMKNH